jgi:hypothetical protein
MQNQTESFMVADLMPGKKKFKIFKQEFDPDIKPRKKRRSKSGAQDGTTATEGKPSASISMTAC